MFIEVIEGEKVLKIIKKMMKKKFKGKILGKLFRRFFPYGIIFFLKKINLIFF